jgi:hypothetical protein
MYCFYLPYMTSTIFILHFFSNNQLKCIWKLSVKVLFPSISVLSNKCLQTYVVKKSTMRINSLRYWTFPKISFVDRFFSVCVYIYMYIYQNDVNKLNCIFEDRLPTGNCWLLSFQNPFCLPIWLKISSFLIGYASWSVKKRKYNDWILRPGYLWEHLGLRGR